MFFRSIADVRGDSLAVILTGSGSDGAVGVSGYGELRKKEPLLKSAPLNPKPWNRELLLRSLVEVLRPRSAA